MVSNVERTVSKALRVMFGPWMLYPPVRVGFAMVVAILFALSYTKPIWVTRFVAPQYPSGLHLQVYLDRVEGDTGEVNGLNHYVGMAPIDQMATLERSLAVGALAVVCFCAVVAASFQKVLWQALLVLPLVLFPFGMMADFYAWLWYAGHSLDPTAPLSMTVKPFTPKIVGEQDIANFHVTSGLGAGAYLQIAGAVLLCTAAILGWRLSKKFGMENAIKA